MKQQASSRAMRLAAALLFAGVPAVAIWFAAMNFMGVASGRAQAHVTEARLRALSDRLDVLDPEGVIDTSKLYLLGDSASLAAADLRTRVVAAISQSDGQLVETRSVDPDPSEERNNVVLLGATFDIDNAGFARLLYALESGTPLIDVTDLSVRRADANGKSENPLLRVDLTVTASRRDAAP